MRIAHELQCAARQTLREVHQGILTAGTAEAYLAAEGQIVEPVQLCVTDVHTSFERVPRSGVGNVVHELIGIDSGAIGLIDCAAEIGNRSAAGNKASGKRKLRDVS